MQTEPTAIAPPKPTADHSIISALKAPGLSNTEIARGIGYSSGAVSTYLNDTYAGDIRALETAAREWLRDRTVAAITGFYVYSSFVYEHYLLILDYADNLVRRETHFAFY